MIKKKLIFGFSLAEALITLLVVSIITIATIPVITKKKRNIDNSHGKWMCMLNSAGQHIMWTNGSVGKPNDPTTWATTGKNYCEFVVPGQARNFAISAVAGGGGGASAESKTQMWTSDFAVNYYGTYKMVAIGGGGAGGKTKCYKKAGGGGAGGVAYSSVYLDSSTTQIKMYKGSSPSPDDGNYNAPGGEDSYIKRVYRNSSGSMAEVDILYAGGGEGGNGRWGLENMCKHGDGKGGTYGKVTSGMSLNTSTAKGVSGCGGVTCFGYISSSTFNTLNSFVSPYRVYSGTNASSPGRGGQPNRSTGADSYGYGRQGNAGYTIAMTKYFRAGGGGKAGQAVSNKFYPSFNEKKIRVTVGKGGAGGQSSQSGNNYLSANGKDGGNTVVGELFGLNGGAGGKVLDDVKALSKISGEDGEKTPIFYKNPPILGYGGFSGSNYYANGFNANGAGAGGGGGGLNTDGVAGNGGNGASGYVIIEW